MITNEDLYKEIKKLDDISEDESFSIVERAFIKSQTLILKLLHNIRRNTYNGKDKESKEF